MNPSLRQIATAMVIAALVTACVPRRPEKAPVAPSNPGCPVTAEQCRSGSCDAWVDVRFDIAPSGAVENSGLVASCPPDVFDDAAVQAVSGWKFAPSPEGQKNQRVRLKFGGES